MDFDRAKDPLSGCLNFLKALTLDTGTVTSFVETCMAAGHVRDSAGRRAVLSASLEG
jgi:hypothetical protein